MMVVDINKLADLIKSAIMEDLSKEFLMFREELKGTIDTFRLSIDDAERRMELLENKIDSLNYGVAELGVKVQTLTNQTTKCLDELSGKLESSKTELKGEISNVTSNIENELKKISKLVGNISRVLDDCAKLADDRFGGLSRFVEYVHRDVQASLNSIQKAVESEMRSIKDLQNKLNELNRSVDEYLKRLNDLQERMLRMEGEFNKKLSEVSDEVERLKVDLKKIKVRDDHLKEIISKINSVKREMKGEV